MAGRGCASDWVIGSTVSIDRSIDRHDEATKSLERASECCTSTQKILSRSKEYDLRCIYGHMSTVLTSSFS